MKGLRQLGGAHGFEAVVDGMIPRGGLGGSCHNDVQSPYNNNSGFLRIGDGYEGQTAHALRRVRDNCPPTLSFHVIFLAPSFLREVVSNDLCMV